MAVGGQEILEASKRGDTGEVERLIREGEDVNRMDEHGRSPIHLASWHGHTDTVELLLDRGANIEEKDNDGDTPIYRAAEGGHTDTVKLLLDRGADPYITNKEEKTARDLDRTG